MPNIYKAQRSVQAQISTLGNILKASQVQAINILAQSELNCQSNLLRLKSFYQFFNQLTTSDSLKFQDISKYHSALEKMLHQIDNDISNFKSSVLVSASKIEENKKKYDVLTTQVNTLIDTFTASDIESLKKSYHKQAIVGDLINASYKLMINNANAITTNALHAWRCLESAVQRMKSTQISKIGYDIIDEAETIKSKALGSSLKSDVLKLLNWTDLICKQSRIYLENSKCQQQIHKVIDYIV
jgi:hypothetical protein